MTQEPEARIKGVLERFIFSNPETHFCVGELQTAEGKGSITITGVLPQVQCGETLELQGYWDDHRQHGRQFKIASFKTALPSSVYGIRKYLGSGMVPGVGKVYANKIVDTFGSDTLKIIDEDSGRLREVPGIGPKRAREIKAAWEEQHTFRNLMMFLQTYGVGVRNCLRLQKRYGGEAEQVLRQDPYLIAREVDGIGFKTADQIARNLGFGNQSAERIDAGTIHWFKEKEREGHTGLTETDLIEQAAQLLEIDPEAVESRLPELKKSGVLVPHPKQADFWQLRWLQRAEQHIVQSLRRLEHVQSALPSIQIEKAIQWAEAQSRMSFAPEQSDALAMALSNKVSILTGGPGTGKTTILRALVQILSAKKARILLAAPTGRAAQRLGEASGKHAATLHRLLRYDAKINGFTMNEDHPLKVDYLIIDETSMLDTPLASALLRAIPSNANLLFVGDSFQLPSVGPGQVLRDLMDCSQFATTKLQQIFRQRKQSGIVFTAHSILEGQTTVPAKSCRNIREWDQRQDFCFIPSTEPADCVEKVLSCVKYFMQKAGMEKGLMDVQVLAPMHRGTAGVSMINREIQSVINPGSGGISLGDMVLRKGDKVIQLKNNYDLGVFNGDMGKIEEIDPDGRSLNVKFDGREIEFARSDLGDVGLAYAITIHKSQGSQFPVVILPLLKQHFMLLQRNLLYTAITRGSRKVILIGDSAAYAMAVQNAASLTRSTGLQKELCQNS